MNDSSSSAFTSRIWNQVGNTGHPLYVRVNLASPHYAWHQASGQHATAAIAYTSSATKTTIADPWTWKSSTGSCLYSGYTATPDTACNWVNYQTSEYYLAKDVVRDSELPMWF